MSKATFDPTRYNKSGNTPFESILERHIERRAFLRSGTAMAALSVMGLAGCKFDFDDLPSKGHNGGKPTPTGAPSLGFQSVPGSKIDAVVVPEGYRARVLAPWGTPLNDNAEPWKADGSNTAQDQLNSVGMHHDGMHFYPLNGSSEDGILCINHEYIDGDPAHPQGITRDTLTGRRSIAEEVRKEIYAHGVTTVRVKKANGLWDVVKNDPHNKRYTGVTEMDVGGPLAGGHELLVTKFSPDGTAVRGTLNNCGSGMTPWGTFLTCEENWPAYFINRGELTADQTRLGIADETSRYGWDEVAGDESELEDEFVHFDVTPTAESPMLDYRNEANGHGYVVEIDPYDPSQRAVKRTALGRFRHENCEVGKVQPGKPVVFYSGHDGRFEYIYKFVSAAKWNPSDASSEKRLAVGAKYMDEGTLYVARFNDDGIGQWLPLTMSSVTHDGSTLGEAFASQADIIINTPGAADLLGATPMDRPEWAAVDPFTGTLYMTLTNNTRREEPTAANPRINNKFGHIIRWDEGADVTEFSWDIFVFGAPSDAEAEINRSGLTDLNQFASPDGLVFDPRGILWIQTDNGATEVEEETNDQMLAIVPAALADANGDIPVVDASNQENLRRFFVGPNDCEVTGLAFSPNYKTFFANIQHPVNWPYSMDATEATPAGTLVRPRAATVVIEKIDGGAVGE